MTPNRIRVDLQFNAFIRWIAAGLTGAAVALGILGLLYLVNAEDGFSHTTAATTFGWIVPIITGVVMGVVAWALLSGRGSSDISQHHYQAQCRCDRCGGTVLGDWRLCPHCGERRVEKAV